MPKRRYAAIYAVWIVLCAAAFLALSRAEDPSRRSGRILNDEAGVIAQRLVRDRGPEFRDFEVVHIAWASKGEVGPEARWVVLLDSKRHSGLSRAVVLELRAEDGALLRVRRPER